MTNSKSESLRIEKIHREFINHKPSGSKLRQDHFLNLISKIGEIQPDLSVGKSLANSGRVIVRKELLVEAMREFLTTCVSCELLLTSVFGEALAIKPREHPKLTLSEIELAVGRWQKLVCRQEYVSNALELVSNVSLFHSYVMSPAGDLEYNHQRTTNASAKALTHLIKIISSSGYSVSEMVKGALEPAIIP